MDIETAKTILTEQGLVISRTSTDDFIMGGTDYRYLPDLDTTLITGDAWGIRYDESWWIAGFAYIGGTSITQITRDLGIAVQSICNVFKKDVANPIDYTSQIPKAIIELQLMAHLPVLLVDWIVLEMYQRPDVPRGLEKRYGNRLETWWLPDDSQAQKIGQIRLENNEWIFEHEKLIRLNTLQDAVQEAIRVFGKPDIPKTSPI